MMNIQKMMQQAKAMQGKMQELQARLADETVEAESGGGAVKITMTCKGECRAITLAPTLLSDDKEMAEDLIKVAINNAKAAVDSKLAAETQKMMDDLGLPPGALGNGLPF